MRNTKQPLIKVVGREKKERVGDKLVTTPEYIYLIPEFVSPTGMTEEQRADHNTMKDIAPLTKLTPNQRAEESQETIQEFNKAKSLINIKNPLKLPGYCLNKP